jgi:hypothetical protein
MDTTNPFGIATVPTSSNLTRSGQVELVSISPADFDQLTRILAILMDQGSITITDSIICQAIPKGTTILKSVISSIVKNLNLHIANPKKAIKSFKSIKGGDVKIIDDDEQKRYLVGNETILAFLPKQLDSVVKSLNPPDLTGFQILGDEGFQVIHIDKELRDLIKTNSAGSETQDILFRGMNACAIYIPETAIININGNKEPIDETNADLILRTHSFLLADSENYEILIGKIDDSYYMITNSKIGTIEVSVYENLNDVSTANMLF